jgi:hypothetical protein
MLDYKPNNVSFAFYRYCLADLLYYGQAHCNLHFCWYWRDFSYNLHLSDFFSLQPHALLIFSLVLLVRILVRKGWLHEIDLNQNQGKICRSTLTRLVLFVTFLVILLGLSFPDSWSESLEGRRRKGFDTPIPLDSLGAAKRVLLAVFPLLMVLSLSLQLVYVLSFNL